MKEKDFTLERPSLAPRLGSPRRGMAVTALATDFAAAVQPVIAQTMITTGTEGLEAGETRIKVQDGEVPAYWAMPAQGKPFPVVLVVQEIFGVHEHIKDICRRLAQEGYMAVAPELYARQGNVSGLPISEIRPIVARVPDAQVMSDLDAAVEHARVSGKADTNRLAITGFCWGGRMTWLHAAHNAGLKAGVAWYGRLVGEESEITPRHPIDIVAELKAPVLGLYGAADQSIPVETVEQMRSACAAAGKTCEVVIYPGAPHAFNSDYRPSYRAEPAKDGWARMLAWFRKFGVA